MDAIKEFFLDMLGGDIFYALGIRIWNACINLVLTLIGITPQELGNGSVWAYVAGDLYNMFLMTGMSLMTLYWLINFCRENANFREKLTLAKAFMSLVQLIVANIVLANLLRYIGLFFNAASNLSSVTIELSIEELNSSDVDFEVMVSYYMFGVFFLLVAAVCGLLIVYSVYRRFLNLYLIVPMGPVALSGIAGGRGISNTAWAWIKTFFGMTFEIVVIALALYIAQIMLNSGATSLVVNEDSFFSNFTECWEAMFTMLIACGSVKSAEAILRRAFGL